MPNALTKNYASRFQVQQGKWLLLPAAEDLGITCWILCLVHALSTPTTMLPLIFFIIQSIYPPINLPTYLPIYLPIST